VEIRPLAALLEDHAFLKGMDARYIDFIAGCSANQRYKAGELLVRDGTDASRTFLVRSGRVSLELPVPGQGTHRLQTIEPGELIGWSWLFPPYRWHFDARALETTMVLSIDGVCLRRKLEADHDLGYAFLLRLVQSMHQRLERTRLHMLDVYESPEARS
jgi:CRP-like cAMP-binding protein